MSAAANLARKTDGPRLLPGVVSNWLSFAVTVASGFLLTPLIIARIGVGSFGVWRLAWSFIGFYGMLNLGSLSAVNRFIALRAGQGDAAGLNRVVSTAAAIFLCTGAVVVLLSFALAGQLVSFFHVGAAQREGFLLLVRLLGLVTAVNFFAYVPNAVLRAHERFVGSNLVSIGAELLRFGLSILVLARGYGLPGLAYATLASAVASFLLYSLLCRLLLPKVALSLSGVGWSTARSLVGFGIFVFITYLGDLLRFQIDSMVIGRFLDMEAVGVYGIATTLVSYILRTCVGVNNVLAPRLARLHGRDEPQLFTAAVLRYSTLMGFFAFWVTASAATVAEDFIVAWAGEAFRAAGPLFLVLMAGMSLDFASMAGLSALQAVKKHHYYAYNSIAEGLANLLLSVLLVRRLGMLGVALGTAIPLAVTKLAAQPLYTSRAVGLRFSDLLLRTILLPGAVAAAVWFLARALGLERLGGSLPWLVLRGLIAAVLYAALAGAILLASAGGRDALRRRILGALARRRLSA